MPRKDLLVVRLIVWEETTPIERKETIEYTKALKEGIDHALRKTQWRYHIRIPRDDVDSGSHKLEIHIKHPLVEAEEKYAAMSTLSNILLISELPNNLRMMNPTMAFTFCPSMEGVVDANDRAFVQYFCKTIVEKLCLGKDDLAKKMLETSASFMSRNSTKFLHQPMVGVYNLAEMTERYSVYISLILAGIDSKFDGDRCRGDIKKGVKAKWTKARGGLPTNVSQENSSNLHRYIAAGVALIRVFVALSPTIKKELQPWVEKLSKAITAGRLAVAKEAYIKYSEKPKEALKHLRSLENPTNEDLAMTVNAFGILMQSTLPLFNELYVVTDAEFATVATLSGIAGAGVLSAAGGGAWWMAMGAAGTTTGPIGMLAVGGVFAVAFGVAAICEGVKWGIKQDTNPAKVLQVIQQTLQECSLFILGLICVAAEKDEKSVYKHMVEDLKVQLGENYGKVQYSKGYYANVSKKLESKMNDLQKGLEQYSIPTEGLR